uniref:Uncharacterized protein n=1 Tax=Anas platyrhynchos platyrhynchos TaxID=8840 RepID=A0A493SUN3_ANAPP
VCIQLGLFCAVLSRNSSSCPFPCRENILLSDRTSAQPTVHFQQLFLQCWACPTCHQSLQQSQDAMVVVGLEGRNHENSKTNVYALVPERKTKFSSESLENVIRQTPHSVGVFCISSSVCKHDDNTQLSCSSRKKIIQPPLKEGLALFSFLNTSLPAHQD